MTTNGTHKWRFFRAGGFDQVKLASGQDLAHLRMLDQKLWVMPRAAADAPDSVVPAKPAPAKPQAQPSEYNRLRCTANYGLARPRAILQ